ncbi:MAG: ADOP family duplicated permease, partial [Gemmatimonadota bacterium]|nr:ADOP family duplicated permease [Gemmatimonadota bacterium]
MHDWRADVRARLRAARLDPQDEAQVVDEVAQHLEAQFAELAPTIGAGAARERLLAQLNEPTFDAVVALRRRRVRVDASRVWGAGSLWRDVRYGLRSLRRSPGLVTAATVALALGIGLTTVMFSIIYGMLIKGLPFDDAPRIAAVQYLDPMRGGEERPFPLGDFVRYRARQRSFEAIGAFSVGAATVRSGEGADRVRAVRMTAGAFDITRVRAMLGRTFTPGDDNPAAPPTVVLSYAAWRDRYAGDSGVVGSTVRVDGHAHTIVGVMPERYEFPVQTIIWLPLQTDAATLRPGEGPDVGAVGRLRPGVSYERANAELGLVGRQLAAERAPPAELHPVVKPFIRGVVPGRAYSVFYAMLGAVILVLLVACANVANLLLGRAVSRTREIGIRTALGASRLAVVRQSLVESSILAGLAAVLGAGIAQTGIVAFNRALVDTDRPFWTDIGLHPPVLAFVLAMAVLASLVSGILPAIQSARLDVAATLKDESHAASAMRAGKLSRAIVVVEIALCSALLLAAGFMTKSIAKLRAVEPGFTLAGVYTARVSPSPGDPAAQRRFLEAVEQRLGALPGVAGAYVGSELPGTGWGGDQVVVEGRTYAREQDYPFARSLAVSAGFFPTFGVRVLRGRAIDAGDRAGSLPVAVISQSFARRHFADVDPIGRRIRLGGPGGAGEWLTIVGVMPTLFAASLRDPWPPEVLTAFWQARDLSSASIAVRGAGGAATAAPIRRIVAALDPEAPVYGVASMADVLARPLWALRVLGTMFVVFGVVSLALAAIGLYAVMAFSVSRRTRELGIR